MGCIQFLVLTYQIDEQIKSTEIRGSIPIMYDMGSGLDGLSILNEQVLKRGILSSSTCKL